jgi:hypothetical protein
MTLQHDFGAVHTSKGYYETYQKVRLAAIDPLVAALHCKKSCRTAQRRRN